MMKTIFIGGLLLLATICWAQEGPEVFRHGKLDNGLTYYIRQSSLHNGTADFYLVQNVGALMEEDNQNGLAHILEHMAFNGTVNFPNGIQGFLKRRGVNRFNAYTGQDETVYHIEQVPVAAQGLVDSCLLILRDWSGFLLLDPKEIDKERGVILEERRTTRDLGIRMQEKASPYIYNGSKYAVHDIIGRVNILENFTPAELRAYYQDFYRPDQQAVIVVGDVEVERIEQQIKGLFGPIAKRVNPKPRLVYDIPDCDTALYYVAIDKEVPSSTISVMQRFKEEPPTSLKEMMRTNLVRTFYNNMVSKRLKQYIDIESPAFMGASVNYGKLLRHYNTYNIIIKPFPGKDRKAFRQLMEQLMIINRYGFTPEELAEQVKNYRKQLSETEEFKDKLSNSVYVTIYQNNFLQGNPLTSVEEDIALSKEILDSLSLEDVNRWLKTWQGETKNRLFLLDGNSVDYPYLTKADFLGMIDSIRREDLKPANYELEEVPLLDFEIPKGQIVKTREVKAIGAEEWTLGNGCRVFFKQTDANRGRVSILGESYGGKSLLKAEELPSAEALESLLLRSGLYKHNHRMMEKILKPYNVSINMHLGETTEGVSGSAIVEESELLFQLMWLMFEKPRFDRDDFDKFIVLSKMDIRTKEVDPMLEVDKKVQQIRMKESPRLWDTHTEEFFDAMNYDTMTRLYRERFGDASDFVFYMVGDLPKEEAKKLVEHYLGSLPSLYRKETYQLHDLRREGSHKADIEADMPDDKYMVNIEFGNHLKMTPKDELCLDILQRILQDRYNAEIREEQGGSYGVSVESSASVFPVRKQFIGVSFQSSLEKGPQMRGLVHKAITGLQELGVEDEEVEDIVLFMKKGRRNMLENKDISYWMETMRSYVDSGKDFSAPAYFEKIIDKIDGKQVQAFAKKFFQDAECTDIVIKSKKQD
ncbi:MAG: insulinase family protein [Odoribacter sp.]